MFDTRGYFQISIFKISGVDCYLENTMLLSHQARPETVRNGEACRTVIENTMLVAYDIKFIRRDQKQLRNGEACRVSLTCFWSSLIKLISKTLTFSIYHALLDNLMAKRHQWKADAVSFELADVANAL